MMSDEYSPPIWSVPIPNTELWLAEFAIILGCEARPAAIAVAIQSLKDELKRAVESIPKHRTAARDAVIREMRQTAVNCGMRSSCAISGWMKLSTEPDGEP